jgi:hypothetical protein
MKAMNLPLAVIDIRLASARERALGAARGAITASSDAAVADPVIPVRARVGNGTR